MSAHTPTDIANVIKLLERLRTGEFNLIPGDKQAKQDEGTAMLQRVEVLLNAELGRMQSPVGDGGSAFPESGLAGLPNGEFIHGRAGMTLRDYFAAKALQGYLSNPTSFGPDVPDEAKHDPAKVSAICAAFAYLIADAMLKERQL